MAMLRICAAAGCETKTLGRYCIDHEVDPAHKPPDRALDGQALARELARRIVEERTGQP